MLGNLSGWHFLIIALVVLLLFGATRLPALAKSVGQSAKIFKKEMKEVAGERESPLVGSTEAGFEAKAGSGHASSAARPVGVAEPKP